MADALREKKLVSEPVGLGARNKAGSSTVDSSVSIFLGLVRSVLRRINFGFPKKQSCIKIKANGQTMFQLRETEYWI